MPGRQASLSVVAWLVEAAMGSDVVLGRQASHFAALTTLPQATTYFHSNRYLLRHCLSVKCGSPLWPE